MPSSARGQLTARNLECLRGDRLVLRGLSLTLQGGEILQVVGANGSGKTSLLRILSGLSAPTAGEVCWRDDDIHRDPTRWRSELLYAGHAAGASPNLTVAENQRFALALVGRPPRVALGTALARVGLANYAATMVGRLSAGQRQRLMLARLLQIPAQAWLLDEPLTALDEDGKHLLENLLTDHAAAGGLAVLATHQHLRLPPHINRQLQLLPPSAP
jgi:heme exporter protein A